MLALIGLGENNMTDSYQQRWMQWASSGPGPLGLPALLRTPPCALSWNREKWGWAYYAHYTQESFYLTYHWAKMLTSLAQQMAVIQVFSNFGKLIILVYKFRLKCKLPYFVISFVWTWLPMYTTVISVSNLCLDSDLVKRKCNPRYGMFRLGFKCSKYFLDYRLQISVIHFQSHAIGFQHLLLSWKTPYSLLCCKATQILPQQPVQLH